eukprot:jgi/Tetstr1/449071/TSEL_036284.t1
MSLVSNKSRKAREREAERQQEEQIARESRAQLVRGAPIPADKSYLWDLVRDPHQAPGPVPAPYAAKPRRYPVERPGIGQGAFHVLVRKKAAATALAAGVGGQPQDEPGAKRRKVDSMLAGNGSRAGLANGMPNGSAHDPEAMAAAHTMAEELEAMKSALHSHDAGQKELLAEQERAAAREAELREQLRVLKQRNARRKAERAEAERKRAAKARVREEAARKAKERAEERASRRAAVDKAAAERAAQRAELEAALGMAAAGFAEKARTVTGLEGELEAMTSEKHKLVMELKQILHEEDEARRREAAAAAALEDMEEGECEPPGATTSAPADAAAPSASPSSSAPGASGPPEGVLSLPLPPQSGTPRGFHGPPPHMDRPPPGSPFGALGHPRRMPPHGGLTSPRSPMHWGRGPFGPGQGRGPLPGPPSRGRGMPGRGHMGHGPLSPRGRGGRMGPFGGPFDGPPRR